MFNIGDVVTVTGKVNYVVAQVDGDAITAESMNTGKARVFEASKLKLVAGADTEPMNTPQEALSVPQDVETPEVEESSEEVFDPRSDRRQSAYGLAILAAVIRKGARNPGQFAHNSNALKAVGSKRAKVRKRVKAKRTTVNVLHREYNRMVRENGYNIAA
jgi:hypothetical protein